jgi:hypothetical protein
MNRSLKQKLVWVGSLTAAALACLLSFSSGYNLGFKHGWNDLKRVMRTIPAADEQPQLGSVNIRTVFPDSDQRMK